MLDAVEYPPHDPRQDDPTYAAFNAYRAAHIANATCWWADQVGVHGYCSGGLELHHGVVDYAVINAADPKLLDAEFPDAGSTQEEIDLWANSNSENLIFLCEKHHRGKGTGAHTVSYALWKSSLVAPSLLA